VWVATEVTGRTNIDTCMRSAYLRFSDLIALSPLQSHLQLRHIKWALLDHRKAECPVSAGHLVRIMRHTAAMTHRFPSALGALELTVIFITTDLAVINCICIQPPFVP